MSVIVFLFLTPNLYVVIFFGSKVMQVRKDWEITNIIICYHVRIVACPGKYFPVSDKMRIAVALKIAVGLQLDFM